MDPRNPLGPWSEFGVVDAPTVVRIIEGAESSASFPTAVVKEDLVFAREPMLAEVANAPWRLQHLANRVLP